MSSQPLTLLLGALVAVLVVLNVAPYVDPSSRPAAALQAQSEAFVRQIQTFEGNALVLPTADDESAHLTIERDGTTFDLYPAGEGRTLLVAHRADVAAQVQVEFDTRSIVRSTIVG